MRDNYWQDKTTIDIFPNQKERWKSRKSETSEEKEQKHNEHEGNTVAKFPEGTKLSQPTTKPVR